MVTYIIGIGLIGGSFAYALREHKLTSKVIGSDLSKENEKRALELGIVDEIEPLDRGIELADLIVMAIPVDKAPTLAIKILNKLTDKQILIDMGSIKAELCEMTQMHTNRARFVATHPMWGTEYSGPDAAKHNAFTGRSVVLCNTSQSASDAVELIEKIYSTIGMNIIHMEAEEHDLHAAYISHISHITSFALALTVLEKEREEQHIFDMASGGFASTVRLAKSAKDTWIPILLSNKYNILDVLREHIHQLQLIRKAIERDDVEELTEVITRANIIKKILD